MRVFVTGATGFVGSAVVQELKQAGHKVVGLARSDSAAKSLIAAGVEVHCGDLEEPESLRSGAATADGVIHTAFIHDFSRIKEVCELERRAIEVIGSELEDSNRPLLITSGTAMVTPGRLATENDMSVLSPEVMPRIATEQYVLSLASRGVRVSLVRLPISVHGDGDHGFVPTLVSTAREKGVSAYVGDGANRWTAVHRLDAAFLYRLVLEEGSAGGIYHAVHEEAIAFRGIAEVIGKRMNVPAVSKSAGEATGHFGWFATFAGHDCPASSKLTRERLGWKPTQPGLIEDLNSSKRYFEK
jgi:nucleoside-diphosphate-sugar epimerase